VGNFGAETECLGDLRRIDLGATASIIRALPGNRDYGAFYDPAVLPATDVLIKTFEGLLQNLVYGDFESVVYRGLTKLGVLSNNVRNFGLLYVSRSCCFSSGGYPPELKIRFVLCC
jgi:hypothetical protein